jgi:hypothetical protein
VFSLFYIAWFKQMAKDWNLTEFMGRARQSSIHEFIEAIHPPMCFLYYLHAFYNHVKDTAILSSLFLECFLRQIVQYSVDYNLKIWPQDFENEKFLDNVAKHPNFSRRIWTFLQAETYYSLIEIADVSALEEIVLSFISQRPPPIKILSSRRQSQYPQQPEGQILSTSELCDLISHKWIVPVGQTSDGCAAFLILPCGIPDLPAHAILHGLRVHFSLYDAPIELFVDLSSHRVSSSPFCVGDPSLIFEPDLQ